MNDIIEAEAGSEAERNTLLIAYILYALGPFTALTAVAGVILNHIAGVKPAIGDCSGSACCGASLPGCSW